MIPWKTFKFRRKLQLASLVSEQKITTYENLVAYLHSLHVEAPSVEEYNTATSKNKTSSTVSSKGTTSTRKTSTAKKTTSSKPKEVEDPNKVWEAGLEGSYSEKKAPAKKKPVKRTTRSTRTTKKKS